MIKKVIRTLFLVLATPWLILFLATYSDLEYANKFENANFSLADLYKKVWCKEND